MARPHREFAIGDHPLYRLSCKEELVAGIERRLRRDCTVHPNMPAKVQPVIAPIPEGVKVFVEEMPCSS